MSNQEERREGDMTYFHDDLLLHHHAQRQTQPKRTPLHPKLQLFLRLIPLLESRLQGMCRSLLHRGGRLGGSVAKGIVNCVERVRGRLVGDRVGCRG